MTTTGASMAKIANELGIDAGIVYEAEIA